MKIHGIHAIGKMYKYGGLLRSEENCTFFWPIFTGLPEVVTALATLTNLVAVKNVLGDLVIYSDFTIVLCTSEKPLNLALKSAGVSLRQGCAICSVIAP